MLTVVNIPQLDTIIQCGSNESTASNSIVDTMCLIRCLLDACVDTSSNFLAGCFGKGERSLGVASLGTNDLLELLLNLQHV